MSNLLNGGYTQLNDLIQVNADDIQTESINTKTLYINNILFDPSGVDLTNYVTTTQLTTALNPYVTNTNLSMQLTNYALLTSLNNYVLTSALTNYITNASLTTTLNNYVTTTNLSNQLSAYITLSQLSNQLSNYVSNTTLTNTLNNYVTTTTLTSYVSTNTLTTELNKYVLTSALSNYITSTSLATTLNNYVLTTALNTKLNDYVLTTALSSYITSTSLATTLTNYITSSSLTTTLTNYVLTTALNTKLNDYVLTTTLNTTNANITALQTKLQDIYYDVPTQYFDINHNAHIYGILKLGAILNVEASIDAIGISVGVAGGAAAKATTDILTINNITLPAMNLVSANLSLRIDALETKTTNQSFNLALNTTYITGTLSLTTVRMNSLDSGILQTANQSVVFIGETEIRNDFRVKNGFGASIDGGIVQNNNSANTFAGSLTVNNNLQCNDFTSGGTNTNINSTNCNITGNAIIKNTSTSSSGTIPPYLSVVSTTTNANARKLQGILIGREQGTNNQSNCNIGYNLINNANAGNYGYLGLNVYTTNVIESFRWFEGGCSVPVGNLTVSSGNLTITSGELKTNTINSSSTNLEIKSVNDININSNTINIGTNQPALIFNTINVGSITSGSRINLNGVVYSPYSFNITGQVLQW
jgi:hypothetical protein